MPTQTPHLNLTLPDHGDANWDTTLNGNFTAIDTAFGSISYPVTSVAGKVGSVTLVASDISGLATVATSGNYADLSGKPTLGALAFLSTVTSTQIDSSVMSTSTANSTFAQLAGATFVGSVTAPNVYATSGAIQGKSLDVAQTNGIFRLWGGSSYDTGLSRGAAATVCVGNGTAGDFSGTLRSSGVLTGLAVMALVRATSTL